jgi:hypothetical protein
METIRLGSKGEAVRNWQSFLGIKSDGSFGPVTQAATVDYQKASGLTPDGVVGPKTWESAMKLKPAQIGAVGLAALILASIASSLLGTDENKLRAKVVKAAEGQLDNTDASIYWKDVMGGIGGWPKDWCGAFALWALHQAGLALNVKWVQSLGFLLVAPHALKPVQVPKPGDIAYFNRSQHHAVVRRVNADGTVDLINGNGFNPAIQNGAISEVAASRTHMSNVTAFYSIQPFIDQRLAA